MVSVGKHFLLQTLWLIIESTMTRSNWPWCARRPAHIIPLPLPSKSRSHIYSLHTHTIIILRHFMSTFMHGSLNDEKLANYMHEPFEYQMSRIHLKQDSMLYIRILFCSSLEPYLSFIFD